MVRERGDITELRLGEKPPATIYIDHAGCSGAGGRQQAWAESYGFTMVLVSEGEERRRGVSCRSELGCAVLR